MVYYFVFYNIGKSRILCLTKNTELKNFLYLYIFNLSSASCIWDYITFRGMQRLQSSVKNTQ